MDKELDLRCKDYFKAPLFGNRIIFFKKYREGIYTISNPFERILRKIIKKNDEIIIVAPYLPSIYNLASFYGKVNVFYDIKDIVVTSHDKCIIVTNPNIITGRVYNKDELDFLVDIIRKNNIYLIIDEEESGFIKNFYNINQYQMIKPLLYVINRVYYKKNISLSLIQGPGLKQGDILNKSYKKLIKFNSSRRKLKKFRKRREKNYQLLKDYCEKRNIIYMKNIKTSMLTINITPQLISKRNITFINGCETGIGNKYITISLDVNHKKIKEFVKRIEY